MSHPANEVAYAHIHAIEKRERNGKWKVRGLEITTDQSVVSPDATSLRYKLLASATGQDFDEASDNAWKKLQTTPELRVYMVMAIRSI
jgi:hypothetical protein